jgi:hypothetical protein
MTWHLNSSKVLSFLLRWVDSFSLLDHAGQQSQYLEHEGEGGVEGVGGALPVVQVDIGEDFQVLREPLSNKCVTRITLQCKSLHDM